MWRRLLEGRHENIIVCLLDRFLGFGDVWLGGSVQFLALHDVWGEVLGVKDFRLRGNLVNEGFSDAVVFLEDVVSAARDVRSCILFVRGLGFVVRRDKVFLVDSLRVWGVFGDIRLDVLDIVRLKVWS